MTGATRPSAKRDGAEFDANASVREAGRRGVRCKRVPVGAPATKSFKKQKVFRRTLNRSQNASSTMGRLLLGSLPS